MSQKPARKATSQIEKIAMHNVVKSLPADTDPITAVNKAQAAVLATSLHQAIPSRSAAMRCLEIWAAAAAPPETKEAPIIKMAATAASEREFTADEFQNFVGVLKPGLYMVRIS